MSSGDQRAVGSKTDSTRVQAQLWVKLQPACLNASIRSYLKHWFTYILTIFRHVIHSNRQWYNRFLEEYISPERWKIRACHALTFLSSLNCIRVYPQLHCRRLKYHLDSTAELFNRTFEYFQDCLNELFLGARISKANKNRPQGVRCRPIQIHSLSNFYYLLCSSDLNRAFPGDFSLHDNCNSSEMLSKYTLLETRFHVIKISIV